MEPRTVGLLGGLLFLLIAIVGGGFTVRELVLPAVPGWARVASLAVGAALVVPYFAGGLAGDAAPSRTAAHVHARVAPNAKPHAAAGRYRFVDEDPELSPENLEVSGLRASGPHTRPVVGDRIAVRFVLRNGGPRPV